MEGLLMIPADPPTAPDIVLNDLGADPRGSSVSVPRDQLQLLGDARDVQVMTIRPGCVRGNHYHARKDELFVVLHQDTWSLHWSHPETEKNSRIFGGSGGVTITMPRFLAHAIRNDGDTDLVVIGLSSAEFNPEDPDNLPVPVA
jgi:dTDP-4-dehydrorhamnose 3,5-epimerase-like enzyme